MTDYILYFFSILSTIITFTINRVFPTKILTCIYYFMLWLLLFIVGIMGGRGVISDAYVRLEEFKELEKHGKLLEAKKNPDMFDGIFQMDLKEFENSDEFLQCIVNDYGRNLRVVWSVLIGVYIAIISELLLYIYKKFRRYYAQ